MSRHGMPALLSTCVFALIALFIAAGCSHQKAATAQNESETSNSSAQASAIAEPAPVVASQADEVKPITDPQTLKNTKAFRKPAAVKKPMPAPAMNMEKQTAAPQPEAPQAAAEVKAAEPLQAAASVAPMVNSGYGWWIGSGIFLAMLLIFFARKMRQNDSFKMKMK